MKIDFPLSQECIQDIMNTGYIERLNGQIFPTKENLAETKQQVISALEKEVFDRGNLQALKLLDYLKNYTKNP